MIKAVIFDMDGVIVDSEIEYIRNVRKILKEHGVTVALDDLYYIGGGPFTYYCENIAKFLNVSVELAGEYYKQFIIDNPTDFKAILRPEAVELMKYLKAQGFKIGLASSGTIKRIDLKLDICGIRGYFDEVVSGQIFAKTKPNPEIFLYTAEKLGVSPQECLVIEDSQMGIDGGHNAGMFVVALYDARFKFNTSNASQVVSNLCEVKGIIEKINKTA